MLIETTTFSYEKKEILRRSGNLVSHYIKDFVIDIFNVSLGFLARRNTQF